MICTLAGVLLSAAPALAASGQADAWEGRVEIAAHRGNTANAPENTLPAFENAINCGAEWIEMDINETKDGTLVLFHDDSLRRVTGRDGTIWETSAEELRSFRFGKTQGPAFAATTVPTLEEALDLCKDKIRLDLEIKTGGHKSGDYIARIIGLLQQKKMTGQCMLTSYDYNALRQVKALDPSIRTALITAQPLAGQDLSAADGVMLQVELATPETVQQLRSQGKIVGAWTVNDYQGIQKCRRADVDLVITDRPAGLL